MQSVIYWCGFLGGWLLVAGPVFQAALELDDADAAREVARRAMDTAAPVDPVSPWWWLLPPVRYSLRRRRSGEFRRRVMSQLDPAERELVVGYISKATGWLYVGAGGILIATKETWELHEHYEWRQWVFWVLVVVMLTLCLTNTAISQQRRATELGPGRPPPAAG